MKIAGDLRIVSFVSILLLAEGRGGEAWKRSAWTIGESKGQVLNGPNSGWLTMPGTLGFPACYAC